MKATLVDVKADQNAILPRLLFDVQIENDSGEEIGFADISGRINVENVGVLRKLLPQQSYWEKVGPNQKSRVTLVLDLDFRQLEIIEEKREVADVLFRLSINYTQVRTREPTVANAFSTGSTNIVSPAGDEIHKVPQSQ